MFITADNQESVDAASKVLFFFSPYFFPLFFFNVGVLLYMCPPRTRTYAFVAADKQESVDAASKAHIHIYMYYYIYVGVLQYMCPHTAACVRVLMHMSPYDCICVRMLLCVSSYYYTVRERRSFSTSTLYVLRMCLGTRRTSFSYLYLQKLLVPLPYTCYVCAFVLVHM